MYQPPKRKSYNDCYAEWQRNMRKLSGQTDVSWQNPGQLDDSGLISAAFETDTPQRTGRTSQAEAAGQGFADDYARNEAAEGRWREDHPNDPTDT